MFHPTTDNMLMKCDSNVISVTTNRHSIAGQHIIPMLQAFSATQEHFAAVSNDNRLKIWDVSSNALLHDLTEPHHLKHQYTCLSWTNHSANRTIKKKRRSNPASLGLIALGTSHGSIVVWDIAQGQVMQTLSYESDPKAHTSRINDILFSQTGTTLFSCALQAKVVLEWDIASGKIIRSFKTSSNGSQRLALSLDNEILAVGGTCVRLFDTSSSKKTRKICAGISASVQQMIFSPCKKFLFVSLDASRFISMYDLSKKEDQTAAIFATPASCTFIFTESQSLEAIALKKKKKSKKLDNIFLGSAISDGTLEIWNFQHDARTEPSSQPIHVSCKISSASTNASNGEISDIFLAERSVQVQDSLQLARGSLVRPFFEKVALLNEEKQLRPKIELNSLCASDSSKRRRVEMNGTVPEKEQTYVPTLQERNSTATVSLLDASLVGFDDFHPASDAANEESDVTFDEQLKPLQDRISDDVSKQAENLLSEISAAVDRKNPKIEGSSLSQVLQQALHTKDTATVEYVLSSGNHKVITRTIQRVSPVNCLALLDYIVQKCEKTPERCRHLCLWVRAIVLSHTAYLMAQPDVLQNLSGLYQVLNKKMEMYAPLHKLSGRLGLLLGQMQVTPQSVNAGYSSKIETKPLVVYDENDEDSEPDADAMEEESKS